MTTFKTPGLQKDLQSNIPVTIEYPRRTQVLVAEDNELNMLLICEVLSRMGLEVIGAANGGEVLSRLENCCPALIFMDINMPVMDGYTATQMIRKLPTAKSGIPIIALTADARKEDKEKCMQAGMNDFVSKPFTLNDIKCMLKNYL